MRPTLVNTRITLTGGKKILKTFKCLFSSIWNQNVEIKMGRATEGLSWFHVKGATKESLVPEKL